MLMGEYNCFLDCISAIPPTSGEFSDPLKTTARVKDWAALPLRIRTRERERVSAVEIPEIFESLCLLFVCVLWFIISPRQFPCSSSLQNCPLKWEASAAMLLDSMGISFECFSRCMHYVKMWVWFSEEYRYLFNGWVAFGVEHVWIDIYIYIYTGWHRHDCCSAGTEIKQNGLRRKCAVAATSRLNLNSRRQSDLWMYYTIKYVLSIRKQFAGGETSSNLHAFVSPATDHFLARLFSVKSCKTFFFVWLCSIERP